MGTYYHRRPVFAAILLLGTLATVSHAEQWNGSQNPNGAIWRPSSVALGFDPSGGGGKKPLLEIQRPLSGDEDVLLSLRSTFRDAKQIKDWADYVFQPDYQLKTLPEVEGFIRAHHHLSDIPSAVEAEQQGIGLGDMQAKLLRKIEELTLHLIEQHKTIESLQHNLARLEETRSLSQSHNRQH
ncbi:MAG: hypothetical protein R3B37_00255 [Nitrospira sp.]|nr:hypothetical protein [Nitrospira sp.]